MYCASCGTTLVQGLSYCNRCGANLAPKESGESKLAKMGAENLVWAIVAMATLGIGAVIALIALMKNVLNLPDALIVILAFSSAVPFLIAEILFIIMLLREMKGPDERASGRLTQTATREIESPHVHSLAEPPLSVAEHTTRTLETVPRKRPAE